VVPRPARGPAARRPKGQATRGPVRDLGRRVMRLVTQRPSARGRHEPKSCPARGVGQLSARFNAIALPRTCSGMAQLAAHDGAQGGEEPGLPLSSFRGWVRTHRSHSACRDRDLRPDRRRAQRGLRERPLTRCSESASRCGARCEDAPNHAPLFVLQDARRGARSRPHNVAAARPPHGLSRSTSLL
jgi:hypothetical protein